MLSKRQKWILEFVEKSGQVSARRILSELEKGDKGVSKPTLLRDLGVLVKEGFIIRAGRARRALYSPKTNNPLLRFFDAQNYFSLPMEKRSAKNSFDWNVFDNLFGLFTGSEMDSLTEWNNQYLEKKSRLDKVSLKKELERVTIELSWKSSELEGNTYSLIDTETLIKDAKSAPGHTPEEATMILNHKRALDYILAKPEEFKKLSASQIRSVHSLIVKGLGIPDDFRKMAVGIIGTNYRPLDNQFQIKEAVDKIVSAVNKESFIPAKALITAIFLSYVQPFVDGNKRSGRIMANALLLAHNWCPISLRSMDAGEYKKAMILFYEQNSARYFKELFIQQFEFAVKNYF